MDLHDRNSCVGISMCLRIVWLLFGFFYARGECYELIPSQVLYTKSRIREQRISRDPFPHLEIQNLFHDSVYECLMKTLSTVRNKKFDSKRKYRKRKKTVTSHESTRESFDINTMRGLNGLRRRYKFTFQQLNFLRSFRKILNELQWEWLEMLREPLSQRTPKFNMKSASYFPKQELVFDWSDYGILPHNDLPGKLATILVYLPVNSANPEMGTVLLKPKEYTNIQIVNGRSSWKYFHSVLNATYIPNSALAFSACDSSWHGVRNIGTKSMRPRISLQFFIRSKENTNYGPCFGEKLEDPDDI